MASKVTIFIVGGVIFVLEILGARILAPDLGTTIIVWATIIGIILASISLGYFFGGRLADKKLNKNLLSLILIIAGVFTLLIIPIKNIGLGLGTEYSYGARSLLTSITLFTIPAILLGMAIIYTIRLEIKNMDSIGRTNGTLYGISTAGSIAGVFLTSFYLIPNFNVSNIISGLGVILFGTAIFVFLFKKTTS